MSIPSLMEKLIVTILFVGFLTFVFGYLAVLFDLLQRLNLPIGVIITIFGMVLILLSLIGLKIFGRFFVVLQG